MKIGRYQLENLIKQRVPFLYLDLRTDESRASDTDPNPLLGGSVAVAGDKVVDYVLSLGVPTTHPIVMICETGLKSLDAAQALGEKSFINVFVVEGGTSAL